MGLKNLRYARSQREKTIPGGAAVEFGRRLGLKAVAGTALVGAWRTRRASRRRAPEVRHDQDWLRHAVHGFRSRTSRDRTSSSSVCSKARVSSPRGSRSGKTKYKIEVTVNEPQSDRRSPVPSRPS